MGCLFAFIAGIMIHIATYELIPTAKKYKDSGSIILFFILGFLVMLVSHFILI